MEVHHHGAHTLIGAIKALMNFDASVKAEVMPTGKAFSVGGASERARLLRSMQRRQRNAIPAGEAPPKNTPTKRRRMGNGGSSGTARLPSREDASQAST